MMLYLYSRTDNRSRSPTRHASASECIPSRQKLPDLGTKLNLNGGQLDSRTPLSLAVFDQRLPVVFDPFCFFSTPLLLANLHYCTVRARVYGAASWGCATKYIPACPASEFLPLYQSGGRLSILPYDTGKFPTNLFVVQERATELAEAHFPFLAAGALSS